MLIRFTKDHFVVAIKWKTRQIKTLFPFKDKSAHPARVIQLVHVVKPT